MHNEDPREMGERNEAEMGFGSLKHDAESTGVPIQSVESLWLKRACRLPLR